MASGVLSVFAGTVSSTVLPVIETGAIELNMIGALFGTGGVTFNPNFNFGLTAAGRYGNHFFWDYYNRVYITPKHIDFGALSGPVVRDVDVWSAWTMGITLTVVLESGAEGIMLAGDVPRPFKALEDVTYTVTALLDGPPTIDASYQFEFSSGDAPVLTMSGSRAKVWPFAVDWSDSYKVTLGYKTDLWSSRSGKEQRRALRATPRRSLEFTSQTKFEKLRQFRRLMASWQNKVMVMPDAVRSTTLTAAVDAGETTIPVAASADWLASGATVVLINGEAREIRKISYVSGLNVEMTAGGASWPAGTKIHPGLEGMVASNMRVNQLTDGVAKVSVHFDVTPASEPALDDGSPEATLAGREVFLKRPNWATALDITYSYPSEAVDYGYGVTATFRPIGFSTEIRRASYVGFNSDQATKLEQIFRRAKGRRGEFYLSSEMDDLPMAAPVLAGNYYLRVPGQEVYAAYANDTVYRAIEIVMRNGARIFRAVELIETINDEAGNDTQIKVTQPWPYNIVPADVRRISWMPVSRFSGDEMTIEWRTVGVAQTQFTMQTLEALPAE